MLPSEVPFCEMGLEMLPEGLCGARKYFQSDENKNIYFGCPEQWEPVLWCCGLQVFHASPGTAKVSLVAVHLLLMCIGA